MKTKLSICFVLFLTLWAAAPIYADIIDFTGGTAYLWDATTFNTNNSGYVEGVGYYVENGYKVEFFVANQDNIFSTIIGDYYVASNDVIHGHWSSGNYGDMTGIKISREDGASFDLNYFILTSNTAVGGDGATGNELTYINASTDGTTISYSQLLPPDDWGFSGSNPQVFLGPEFDSIKWFSFSVGNAVDCFGMDNFYINEPAPGIPEPSTVLLLGSGLCAIGLAAWRRRK